MTVQTSKTIAQLERVQLRRKAAIWLIALTLPPLLLFVSATAEPGTWAHSGITTTGLLAIFAAIIGRSWCTLYIGGRKNQELVTIGPYSLMRNPLYVFSFLGVWGLAAQTGSMTIAAITVIIAYAVFLPVVWNEEAALSRLHGSQFLRYKQRVSRFMPNPTSWRDVDEMPVVLRRWRVTIMDGCVMLCLIPVVRGVGWLQSALPDLPIIQLP